MRNVMNKTIIIAAMLTVAVSFSGCEKKGEISESTHAVDTEVSLEENAQISETEPDRAPELLDGIYTAEFTTDSSMFRVSEACEGKGILTVENGKMTIHISLGSKNILNLYPGLAEDAKKEGAKLLLPTEDIVTYSDGITEEVYGFDVPVLALDREFDLALVGKKGTWYDHKVCVSNPVITEEHVQGKTTEISEDGIYSIEISFEGGSGKAEILSPVKVTVTDGKAMALIQWNSPNYDYMIVGKEKYFAINTEGNSVFEIPVQTFDETIHIIGNTVAMSKPHEVEYMLTFHTDTIKKWNDYENSSFDSRFLSDTEIEAKSNHESRTEDLGLIYKGSMKLQYAENFMVDYYEGGYTILTTTMDNEKFLIVPKGKNIPENLQKNIQNKEIVALQHPVDNIYLVASSAMDIFTELDALDAIRFSGQKEDSWYIEEAREAMAKGDILYAGKYNRPDYEMITSRNCTLAIENMMITHSPEVTEKLEDFGIPVMIDYSSYESHPFGRAEWVKFYGALLGKEEVAEMIFEKQETILERVKSDKKTDKTIAFFFITSNGLMQVRQSSDYIPKMIELAGGTYIFEDLGDSQTRHSTITMQVEEFYTGAKDADFLIYNSAIDGGVSSVKELLDKCSLLADFKAVKENNVWCTTNDMYQQPLSIGYLMEDIHTMLQGEKKAMHYLSHLE